MTPAVVDHASAAVARLAQWAKDRPNLVGLLNVVNKQSQALETALQDLLIKRVLATATDDQLDQFGAIVGQPRGGDDNTTYRQRISARILLNRSSGTIPEILRIMRTALISVSAQPNSLWFHTDGNGSFEFTIMERQTSTLAGVMKSFLALARAAGVRGVLEWWESEPSQMFRLDVGPGLDQGHLAGASNAR